MPKITLDPYVISYSVCDHGSPQSMILVHGSGGDRSLWPKELEDLNEVNLYLLDLPGHGNSRGDAMESVDSYADAVSRFVDALSLKRVILCGHSLGSGIALVLALRKPRWLEALVLVGAGARLRVFPAIFDLIERDYPSAANLICKSVLGPASSPALIDSELKRYAAVRPEVLLRDLRACDRFDVMGKLPEISVPVLAITGSADMMTPVKYARFLEKNIANAVFAVIEGAGHLVAMERPQEFTDAVRQFIGRLA